MAREVVNVFTYIVSRRSLVVVFTFTVLLLLSVLSLSALANIKATLNIFDVFYPARRGVATIVVSSNAISPLTSLVNSEVITQKLSNISGVEVRFVFVTLGIIDGKPVVVYEVSNANDTCAYLDEELAKRAEQAWGGYVPIYSVFTKQTVFLKVCGTSSRPGVGVSHNTIAKIRGVSPEYYSYALVDVFDENALSAVYRALVPEVEVEPHTLEKILRRAATIAIRMDKAASIAYAENPTQVFLERLGVHRDYVVGLAYFTALVTIVCLPLLGIGIVEFLKSDVEAFVHVLGVARTSMTFSLTLIVALALVLSNAISWLLLSQGIGLLVDFLGYTPSLGLGATDLVAVAVAQLALCTTGIAMRMRSIEA